MSKQQCVKLWQIKLTFFVDLHIILLCCVGFGFFQVLQTLSVGPASKVLISWPERISQLFAFNIQIEGADFLSFWPKLLKI